MAGDWGLAEAVKVLARGHHQALRALANRLVGILHGCLRHHRPYDEQVAWPAPTAAAA